MRVDREKTLNILFHNILYNKVFTMTKSKTQLIDQKEHKDFKELQETLIQVGLRIAKRGEGALFVVGEVPYRELVDQQVPPFKVSKNPKLLESLAIMDGAVIIDKDGLMKAYGVMIKSNRTFKILEQGTAPQFPPQRKETSL
jgi:DNA integrity scanning protein DisA with diadenylate cyclase activity